MEETGRPEVLVAKMVRAGQMPSRREKSSRLTPSFSVTASMTRPAERAWSAPVVKEMFASVASRSPRVTLPLASSLSRELEMLARPAARRSSSRS